ncbi:Pex19 protein family-domain-containing protein [Fomitopsis serialis]|uniref:Pex19 protein family-domain-containing protein n=1 Tax=Fomitopsis serialis TaxID=139415 RepID=UPI00200747EC|nr:Pex19 protein family-domain-containing protein [Neoantrodia serialis]KAH9918066.1 Pex19 protein family-domain-containing protein [Neoantrodia serialis]
MSSSQKQPRIDDDDLDDLDDVLEQFQPKGTTQKQAASAGATPSLTAASTASNTQPSSLDSLGLDEDFMRELTQGMESLMREIATGDGPQAEGSNTEGQSAEGGQNTDEKQRQEALHAAWEKMFVESMNGALDVDSQSAGATDPTESSGSGGAAPPPQDSFEASIRKAMEKLKESESNLKDGPESSVDDLMAQLGDNLDGLDPGEADELQKVLENMMTELMSKEILYEPLKELHDKFPAYMKEHDSTLSADDKKRYNAQYSTVSKLITIFDDPTYSDSDPEKGSQVVKLMTEMQSHGSPPAEIMAPLPPGLDIGGDGLPKMPDGCIIA